ncbi:MAG: DoxX family membrane protein [Patescibacteria group bacterium]
MTKFQKIAIFLLRVSTGWVYLYAGIRLLSNPENSAAGYIMNAKTFTGFYHWLASPDIVPIITFISEWGLLLLGISLVLGIFVRLSSFLGAFMMLMFYFPVLQFPYPSATSFIVDEHITYALVLIFLGAIGAGRAWGLDKLLAKLNQK